MTTFVCKRCNGKQYSAAETDEPCIYCGKGPVEAEDPEMITLQLDKQIATEILKKLEVIADSAEESYCYARNRNSDALDQYRDYLLKTRRQYTLFRRSYLDAQGR